MFEFNGQVYKLVNGKKEDITSKVCKAVKRFATKFLKQNQMEDIFIDERIETHLLMELGKKVKSFFENVDIIVSQGWEILGDYCNLTSDDLFDIEEETVNEETVAVEKKIKFSAPKCFKTVCIVFLALIAPQFVLTVFLIRRRHKLYKFYITFKRKTHYCITNIPEKVPHIC